jgi:kynurenine formamidase
MVIDLSHALHDRMQIFPGDQPPEIKALLNHEDDGCLVSQLKTGVHAGTHIDAPIHFVAGGASIDTIPCQRFIGNGLLIDATAVAESQVIGSDEIAPYLGDLSDGDFAIFRTGWDRFYGTDKYFQHPFLSPDCAHLLVEKGVSLVGLDAMSVDRTIIQETAITADMHQFPVHEILLGSGVLIVENLCRLDRLIDLDGRFAFFPLKVKGADGSPVRAVFLANH